jgi:hypothetical protein
MLNSSMSSLVTLVPTAAITMSRLIVFWSWASAQGSKACNTGDLLMKYPLTFSLFRMAQSL